MSDAARYEVGTIWQMAEIPEEAAERFIAELPEMLRAIRLIVNMNKATGLDQLATLRAPIWIDDDKGTATASYAVSDDAEPFAQLDLKPLLTGGAA